jgi:alpha,alpha-trehalase
MRSTPVLDYIRANWERSFFKDENGSGFHGDDLPYPYSSPCLKGEGKFYFFFYWDTYFTNRGLLRHGYREMAKNNIRNMLWLIRRQGFMPNHVALFNRSQSPYLCRMVSDYFEAAGGPEAEPEFFAECASGLRQEYNFWMTARLHGSGLNRHGHCGTWVEEEKFAEKKRVVALNDVEGMSRLERRRLGSHYLAEAEATCDFTPRFEHRCLDYVQVDLNGLLYEYELFFDRHADRLGWKEYRDWGKRAASRLERIDRYFWNEERGLYLDYDEVNDRHSPVAALTGMQLLAHGIPDDAKAARMVANLPLFEREHGPAYTEECPNCHKYQWAYPNVWPPMVSMLVQGLRRYGYEEDAVRIARKYIDISDWLFEKTGQLWEKVHAEKCAVGEGEYAAQPLMDWAAGVYVELDEFLSGGE